MPAAEKADKPLTLPSENGFSGIWAAASSKKCPITLKELVEVHNACVKLRSIGMPARGGGWAFPELAPFKNKVWQFLDGWQFRLHKIIKTAHRIECLEGEEADSIPRLFLKTWNKDKATNAQDDFIQEPYVKTFQLAHMREDQSFADFYEATFKKLSKVKLELRTMDEVQDLAMICILDYKVLGGSDLQWREKAAESSSFLRDAELDADDDAPAEGAALSPGRRRSARSAASSKHDKVAASAPAGSDGGNALAGADGGNAPAGADGGNAPAGADGGNASPVADGGNARAGENARVIVDGRILDMDDIVTWSWNTDEFPLNQVASMKFDGSRPLADQRTFHAAAILLFYRKRTAEQEKVFRDLTGVWGNARGTHISHALLSHPPTAGSTMYSPGEIEWCKTAQTALIAQMDSALRKELEIPDPIQPLRKRDRRGQSLEGEASLLQAPK